MTPRSSAPLFVGIDIGAHAIQICTSADHNENLSLVDRWDEYLMQLLGTRPIVALEPTGRHYAAQKDHVGVHRLTASGPVIVPALRCS